MCFSTFPLIAAPCIWMLAGCAEKTVTTTRTETVTETLALNACETPLHPVQPVDWSKLPVNIYEPTSEDGLSAQEQALYDKLMQVRAEAGLPPVPLSPSLTLVAGRHALDTSWNILGDKTEFPEGTIAHSWSDAPYYADHSAPRVMWQSPRRLGTPYCGRAYEISATFFPNIDRVLSGWIGSDAHRAVILNEDNWSNKTWQAIGVGIVEKSENGPAIYHVIFGDAADPTEGEL